MVTLTAQLTASQPSTTQDLPMLLQYVIFPLNTNPAASVPTLAAVTGHPTCELWVEPQYGTVTQAPPGLRYILGCRHEEIADKVCQHNHSYSHLSHCHVTASLCHVTESQCHVTQSQCHVTEITGIHQLVRLTSTQPIHLPPQLVQLPLWRSQIKFRLLF